MAIALVADHLGLQTGIQPDASIGGGAIGRITEFATIVGLVVIGGFAPSIVHLVTPVAYSQNITVGGETATQTVSVQAQLDAVLPYMLPARSSSWLIGC